MTIIDYRALIFMNFVHRNRFNCVLVFAKALQYSTQQQHHGIVLTTTDALLFAKPSDAAPTPMALVRHEESSCDVHKAHQLYGSGGDHDNKLQVAMHFFKSYAAQVLPVTCLCCALPFWALTSVYRIDYRIAAAASILRKARLQQRIAFSHLRWSYPPRRS